MSGEKEKKIERRTREQLLGRMSTGEKVEKGRGSLVGVCGEAVRVEAG